MAKYGACELKLAVLADLYEYSVVFNASGFNSKGIRVEDIAHRLNVGKDKVYEVAEYLESHGFVVIWRNPYLTSNSAYPLIAINYNDMFGKRA